MDLSTFYMIAGFFVAAYSVIGNDSVQTLGTFMASNRHIDWRWLWGAMSAVLVATVVGGWMVNGGDISYGRLAKIPFQEIQWYHVMAPTILLILTRFGIPVSTSFLVLSAFASTVVMEKMLVKSLLGYGVAAVAAYITWIAISTFLNEKTKPDPKHDIPWRIAQWLATAFLWFQWLSHDMANIAVFLPRQLDVFQLFGVCAVFVSGLAYIFYNQGGKIQNIVIEKSSTKYVRSATFIDVFYALVLWYFKEYNEIPMSTTWVFVGMLCGRELAISTMSKGAYKLKNVFPLVGRDALKMTFGALVSVAIVIGIHSM